MNKITRSPLHSLGYNFIPAEYLPKGKDEYYLRNQQNKNGIHYRHLSAHEIEMLVRNRNTSDDWNKILVSDKFNPELVQDCKFYGLVRIGKLEPFYLEFHNLRRPVGLYNSTIISCDFGDNVVVDNVNYISHYIIGNDVILVNVNEIATTDHSKFGNGILKQGEEENIRIWMEVCNENAGRSILPFDGMLPGDAFLWTYFRDNEKLLNKFKEFTAKKFDHRRGYYGSIGDRTVVKNCRIIKDVNIGSDAYLKGANKIKNVTINSSAEAITQVGEGCELVNGIIGYGCRVFYGVKAVRFVLGSHSQLKYGARLINSYLGDNSTISCCEVLNSLIFPLHEQHHNNSFLCAALIQGQSNMAAGATIGSNHNSRSPDGEIVAGRGFWPGLCVSLKHNSKFASYTIIAKGDYSWELNIPIPFSLVSNDHTTNQLVVMPAYWFMHNMYALARNSWKYTDRDKRIDKTQHLEFNFLAPDTINDIVKAMRLLQKFTGKAWLKREGNHKKLSDEELMDIGKTLLDTRDPVVDELTILAEGFENSRRPVRIIKTMRAYHLFREMIMYNAVQELLKHIEAKKIRTTEHLLESLPANVSLAEWMNVGGQLILRSEIDKLIQQINTGKLKGWEAVHDFYRQQAKVYQQEKLAHAMAAVYEIFEIDLKRASPGLLKSLLNQSIATREWMVKEIYESRAKDYRNPFRKLVYETTATMEKVVGKLENNSFIKQEQAALETYKKEVGQLIAKLKLGAPKAKSV
jgi:Nucleoside-diphosphate-sugar pyrophosphorylase involved in lipopolysaccharide biosynthesis/translation initiation factor 2B, gamma/epsilon subunits (eIF-2Bgamma/eIF-2Bepsilon)